MGVSIGQIATSSNALSTRQGAIPRAAAQGQEPQALSPQVGFGKGTVSGPSAVVLTLSTNLQQARRVIPTLDQVRAESRAKAEEAAELMTQSAAAKASPEEAVESPETVAKPPTLGLSSDAQGNAQAAQGVAAPKTSEATAPVTPPQPAESTAAAPNQTRAFAPPVQSSGSLLNLVG